MGNFKKLKIISFFIFLILGLHSVAFDIDKSNVVSNFKSHEHELNESSAQIVYVCMGPYAYVYHSTSECPGLGNCSGEIKYTDESTALNSLGRDPCCRCWSNVAGRCKDDNTAYSGGGGGGGGGDNSALGYAALAVVVASVAILSNDIYVYRIASFQKANYNNNINARDGYGWALGFRKTFKKSALEYGASFINSYRYNYYSSDYSTTSTGFHINFVHHIFTNKMPPNLRAYLGGSFNVVQDAGYGGILGLEYLIKGRLKIDARYELTTQTNQLQIGLIFKYQKKYLWQ